MKRTEGGRVEAVGGAIEEASEDISETVVKVVEMFGRGSARLLYWGRLVCVEGVERVEGVKGVEGGLVC